MRLLAGGTADWFCRLVVLHHCHVERQERVVCYGGKKRGVEMAVGGRGGGGVRWEGSDQFFYFEGVASVVLG